MNVSNIFAATFFAFAILIPGYTHAQFEDISQGLRTLELDLSPSTPGPNENVRAVVRSYSIDLDRSIITWTIDGVEQGSGRGNTSIDLTTGPVGSALTIEVRARSKDGIVLSEYRVIRPAFVGLIWEANTYTPPLYKGRSLHTPGSEVRVVAEPLFVDSSGTRLNPDTLVYKWKQNNQVLQDASGYGKRELVVRNDKFVRPMTISVDVESYDQTIIGENSVTISVTQPELVLYEYHPLLGERMNAALDDNYTLTNEEVTIIAEPYHMSVAHRDEGALTYNWTIDDSPVVADGRITLRSEGAGSGRADLVLVLQHTAEVLQSARKTLSVMFDTVITTPVESAKFF